MTLEIRTDLGRLDRRMPGVTISSAHWVMQYWQEKREVLPALGDTIRFHGAVGGAARVRALGQARALLHLIEFDEPFGLSVVEAMACGTPVIATRRGSMAELIEDGVNGFLIDHPDEAPDAIARIGGIDRAACRASAVERFSVERMAAEYDALYRRILSGGIDEQATLAEGIV